MRFSRSSGAEPRVEVVPRPATGIEDGGPQWGFDVRRVGGVNRSGGPGPYGG